MNGLFGRIKGTEPEMDLLNASYHDVEGISYVQFLKQNSTPRPAKTWIFLDGHPDFLRYGSWLCAPNLPNGQTYWEVPPGWFHRGGCGFSFEDGHSENKTWRSATSKFLVNYSFHNAVRFDAAGRNDFAWYLERTGFIEIAGRKAMFNY